MIHSKRSLALKLSKDHGMPVIKAYELITKFTHTLKDILSEGEGHGVTFTNLFTIKTFKNKERIGVNPVTREHMTIPSRNKIHVRNSANFLKELNKESK